MPKQTSDQTDATNTSRVPEAGEQAPDFTLADGNGRLVHLADLRGTRVILNFYPKDDTPGCTAEACGSRDSWQELGEESVQVYGVSRDTTKSHQKFARKHALPFILLSDEDGAVAQQYGVWVEKSMYSKKYRSLLNAH